MSDIDDDVQEGLSGALVKAMTATQPHSAAGGGTRHVCAAATTRHP